MHWENSFPELVPAIKAVQKDALTCIRRDQEMSAGLQLHHAQALFKVWSTAKLAELGAVPAWVPQEVQLQ
jgi:hypothetical protein